MGALDNDINLSYEPVGTGDMVMVITETDSAYPPYCYIHSNGRPYLNYETTTVSCNDKDKICICKSGKVEFP